MLGKRFKFGIIVCALAVTGTHLVSADGKFFFSDRSDLDYIAVKKLSSNPFKFRFSHCRPDGACVDFGKKQGYSLEDVRIQVFKLEDKRQAGRLSTSEAHDLETLQEIIRGIESPRVRYPDLAYSHLFRRSPELFIKTVDDRLGAK